MQLYERGLVDLGAPASEYLRSFRLVPAKAGYQPTVRHLLTQNHGFATPGQIVEDVTDVPLDRHMRDHLFAPLGMEQTDLVRSEQVRARLATGYVLRARGLKPVADRDVPAASAGGACSTASDMARYLIALLDMGAGAHGRVLQPDTLATMWEPHYQPHPRALGWGLGFELGDERGHRTVGHTGILSGFLSAMIMAPDDGIGVFA